MTKFGTINNKGKVTELFELDLNKVGSFSSNPLAFSYGMSRAIQLKKEEESLTDFQKKYEYYSTFESIHSSKYSELSQEYLRGFKLGYTGILLPEGTKIRKGTERTYLDLEKNILNESS